MFCKNSDRISVVTKVPNSTVKFTKMTYHPRFFKAMMKTSRLCWKTVESDSWFRKTTNFSLTIIIVEVLSDDQKSKFRTQVLQLDDICGPCVCKDDEMFLKNIAALQLKCDCLEYKHVSRKVSEVYLIHKYLVNIIQGYCD